MNIRLQKYKKNRLAGMNKYNAARAAGFSESTAKSHAKDLEKRANIADILERQGLTDNILVTKHKELLEAKEFVIVDNLIVNVEKGGMQIPIFPIQIKALELAYKLKDLLRDKVEHSGKVDGGETNIFITNLKGAALVDEARRRNLPLPLEIERRMNAKIVS